MKEATRDPWHLGIDDEVSKYSKYTPKGARAMPKMTGKTKARRMSYLPPVVTSLRIAFLTI